MAAYTPIVLPADLNSVKYQEIIDEITRNDGGALATEAIATAIDQMKIFLARFDLVQLFGDPTVTTANPSGIAATYSDNYLIRMLKNIAIWHLLTLSNANVEMATAKSYYDDAIAMLQKIGDDLYDTQWPLLDNSPNIISYQQRKRNNTGFCDDVMG